jgi:hypothetical protein
MWPEAEFHEGFGFRQAGLRKTVGALEASHRRARRLVPLPVWLFVEKARLSQPALDFLDAFRLEPLAR